jgi:hypothetical protein
LIRRLVELWPWLPREGRPPVPVAVLILLLALAFAATLLFAWLAGGLPGPTRGAG